MQNKTQLIYPELCYQIYGVCFNIHNELGRFRNERQYADAFESKLKDAKIAYVREAALAPSFKGEADRRNIPDFVVEDKLIVDLKAKCLVTKEDYFQMLRYLQSANKKLGLIVNFRQKYLSPKRVAN